jgi:putative hydrolase of the HAD superfamily
MIPSQVRCVLFDAVGTLIYADPPVDVAYAAAAGQLGLTLDEATIGRRFSEAFRKLYARSTGDDGCTTSEEIERSRWRAIVDEVFHEVAPCEALFEQLWNHFAQPTNWRLFEDVAECVRRLGDCGLSLGVASNFDQRLIRICRSLPPLDRCENYFVSSQIGIRKPAIEFFRAVERTTSLQPHELMLVGDDWDADYLAATAAGWHAVHLSRSDGIASPASILSLADLSR